MLAERMANMLSEEGIIADEEKEIVQFGLESLEGNLLSIFLTLMVGICLKRVEEAWIMWLLLFPLRKNAGGYHATTKLRCLIISAVTVVLSFMLFAEHEYIVAYYMAFAVIAICIIWVLAPVENPSKELDTIEQKVYRRRTRIFLGVEIIILMVSLLRGYEILAKSVCMALFITCTSLVMGSLKLIYIKFKHPNG